MRAREQYPAATKLLRMFVIIALASGAFGLAAVTGTGMRRDVVPGLGLLVGASMFAYFALKVWRAIHRARRGSA